MRQKHLQSPQPSTTPYEHLIIDDNISKSAESPAAELKNRLKKMLTVDKPGNYFSRDLIRNLFVKRRKPV